MYKKVINPLSTESKKIVSEYQGVKDQMTLTEFCQRHYPHLLKGGYFNDYANILNNLGLFDLRVYLSD